MIPVVSFLSPSEKQFDQSGMASLKRTNMKRETSLWFTSPSSHFNLNQFDIM
jgi:hypothetical protein